MSAGQQFLQVLKSEMPTPGNYGWFHILALTVMLGLILFLCIKEKDCPDKTFRRILLVSWIVIICLEIYKQIAYVGFQGDPGSYHWEYGWGSFPFQFCSTPIYILPFAIFLRDGKLRDAAMSFLSGFSLFAGLAVCLYPNDVFIPMIGINIQTMVHHGLQLVLGIFIAVHNRKKLGLRWYLSSIPVFAGLVAVAMTLNAILPRFIGEGHRFNMFFVNPKVGCTLPVLSLFYESPENHLLPYPVFLLLYLVGFSLCALLVQGAVFGLTRGKRKKEEAKVEEKAE